MGKEILAPVKVGDKVIYKKWGGDEIKIDGKELKPTNELKKLFDGNDFGSNVGAIGCALSHYNLWKQLVEDSTNEYYLIIEDDLSLFSHFKETYDKIEQSFRI